MAETLKNYSGSEKQYDLDDMQALLSSEVAALKSELGVLGGDPVVTIEKITEEGGYTFHRISIDLNGLESNQFTIPGEYLNEIVTSYISVLKATPELSGSWNDKFDLVITGVTINQDQGIQLAEQFQKFFSKNNRVDAGEIMLQWEARSKKEGEVGSNRLIIDVLPKQDYQVTAERIKPQSVPDGIDLMETLDLNPFTFDPLLYSKTKGFFIITKDNYLYPAWSEEISLSKKGTEQGYGEDGELLGTQFFSHYTYINGKEFRGTPEKVQVNTTGVSDASERHVYQDNEGYYLTPPGSYYTTTNDQGEQIIYRGKVTRKGDTAKYLHDGTEYNGYYGKILDFDPAEVVLRKSAEINLSIGLLLKYLREDQTRTITIYSNASFSEKNPSDTEELAQYNTGVVRERTRYQSQKIKEILTGAGINSDRISTVGLGDEGAYDGGGNSLGIQTRIIEGLYEDKGLKSDIKKYTPERTIIDRPVGEDFQSKYPFFADKKINISKQKEQIQSYLQSGSIANFLTFIQEKEGLITQEDRRSIIRGINAFTTTITTRVQSVLNDSQAKEVVLEKAKKTRLGNQGLKDLEIVAIYMISEFYQENVKYDTTSQGGKFGTTFSGFTAIDPNRKETEELQDTKVLMDCDIMSLIAYGVMSELGIETQINIFSPFGEETSGHANISVGEKDMQVELTGMNLGSIGEPPRKLKYRKPTFTTSKGEYIVADFMNTYRTQGMSNYDLLQRDWLRAILHEENIGDLINRIDALVNNMGVWIEEGQQTKYSEIIQSITLVFNMYEAMKKNSMVDDKYLPFKYGMTVLLEELDKTFLYNNDERYFRRLKNKRVDLN